MRVLVKNKSIPIKHLRASVVTKPGSIRMVNLTDIFKWFLVVSDLVITYLRAIHKIKKKQNNCALKLKKCSQKYNQNLSKEIFKKHLLFCLMQPILIHINIYTRTYTYLRYDQNIFLCEKKLNLKTEYLSNTKINCIIFKYGSVRWRTMSIFCTHITTTTLNT